MEHYISIRTMWRVNAQMDWNIGYLFWFSSYPISFISNLLSNTSCKCIKLKTYFINHSYLHESNKSTMINDLIYRYLYTSSRFRNKIQQKPSFQHLINNHELVRYIIPFFVYWHQLPYFRDNLVDTLERVGTSFEWPSFTMSR